MNTRTRLEFGGSQWATEDILVTVRAYPEPSMKYREISCVAGVTDHGQLRRLHPVPDRNLDPDDRFRKFDVIRVETRRSDDPRPESRKINLDVPITKVARIDSKQNWALREPWVEPFRIETVEELWAGFQLGGAGASQSLALIRPRSIRRLLIARKKETEWSADQRFKLERPSLLAPRRNQPVEFIPYDFSYEFVCANPTCNGHTMQVLDWEIKESFRKWSRSYGDRWETKLRQKYEQELLATDLQFFIGTMRSHPGSWLIIGLYYPKHATKIDDLKMQHGQRALF